MFIAMNRFKVLKEEAGDFEAMWLGRESHLEKNPGFVEFHMLKGPSGRTISSTRRIRCGRRGPSSSNGPPRSISALRIAMPAATSG